jgi:hypothetical protein
LRLLPAAVALALDDKLERRALQAVEGALGEQASAIRATVSSGVRFDVVIVDALRCRSTTRS